MKSIGNLSSLFYDIFLCFVYLLWGETFFVIFWELLRDCNFGWHNDIVQGILESFPLFFFIFLSFILLCLVIYFFFSILCKYCILIFRFYSLLKKMHECSLYEWSWVWDVVDLEWLLLYLNMLVIIIIISPFFYVFYLFIYFVLILFINMEWFFYKDKVWKLF